MKVLIRQQVLQSSIILATMIVMATSPLQMTGNINRLDNRGLDYYKLQPPRRLREGKSGAQASGKQLQAKVLCEWHMEANQFEIELT